MGSTIAFAKRLGSVGISRDLVVEIVRGRHPLSSLLFGSLDLDNIDNVLRMAWALGEPSDQGLGLGLAKELRISDDGSVRCAERNRHLIVRWLSIRRRVYEVLVFDMPTVAAQAVLAEAINIGFEEGWLTDLDWTLTDEQLLDLLRSKTPTKRLIQEQYLSELPTPLFVLQLGLELGDLGFKDRGAVQRHIRVAIKKEAPDLDPLAYAFVDRGAFEKRCTFVDPNGTPWEEGSSSKSVVLYGFSQGRTPVPARQAEKVLRAIVASLGISEEQILKASSMSSQEGNGQTAFTFSH